VWSCARCSLALVAALAVFAPGVASGAAHIRISATGGGRTFDGVGAISGGGGNSRYLVDYPEPARSGILDYLFKPNYGAALQILKVEIGGDTNATDGAESSIEHTQGAVNCDAGYGWWIMEQAKARNPAIRLYALAWGAPGWTGSFLSQRTIAYILQWLRCARRHGLEVDYLAGDRNESHYAPRWTEQLRRSLDAAGFAATRIVMAEDNAYHGLWPVANRLARDPRFAAVTNVIGEHEVCGYPTTGIRCRSTAVARRLGKPLWGTELGGLNADDGAPKLARAIIRGYPQARVVGYIMWPLVSAIPPGLPHQMVGLITAKQPWSGNYRVSAMSYAIAMMTWFTAPGWRYVAGASGGLGPAGGYARGGYTTLRAPQADDWSTIAQSTPAFGVPQGQDWSTIAETTTARAPQRVSFTVGAGLAARTVHVWRTRPGSAHARDWMVRARDVHPVHRTFRYRLDPGYVYTFTTLARHARGTAKPPSPHPFGAYVDRPGTHPLDDAPAYLMTVEGAFEHRPCATDPARTCTQQMTPRIPVSWRRHAGFPYAVLGDESLRDYTVSSDVLFTQAGASAGVLARFSHRGKSRRVAYFDGYILALRDSGTWQLLKNDQGKGVTVLRSGRLATRPGLNRWHRLSLTAAGPVLTVRIDGRRLGSALDRAYAGGIAGIEAGATAAGSEWTGTSWPTVQYRDLTVTP
jgi:Glycosyl hydrolase family 59